MKKEPFLIQAILVGIVIALLFVMMGCASKKIMQNCVHKSGEFYECEEP